MNTQRLIEIIEDFKIVRDKTQLEISPDALFTNARALFISELIAQQRGKSPIRQAQVMQIESPATDKQINFLKSLGVALPDGLTKRQAFLLIKEKMGDNER